MYRSSELAALDTIGILIIVTFAHEVNQMNGLFVSCLQLQAARVEEENRQNVITPKNIISSFF